jgi:hypothetical protein
MDEERKKKWIRKIRMINEIEPEVGQVENVYKITVHLLCFKLSLKQHEREWYLQQTIRE